MRYSFSFWLSNEDDAKEVASEAESENNNETENLSLEKQIKELMNENNFSYDKIIDYDIKDDFIYAVVLETNGALKLALLKNNDDGVKWIAGDSGVTVLSDKGSPVVSIFNSDNNDMAGVKEVKVFGKPAK